MEVFLLRSPFHTVGKRRFFFLCVLFVFLFFFSVVVLFCFLFFKLLVTKIRR